MRKKIKERRGNRPSSVILEAAIIISFMILTIIVLLWKPGMSRNTFTCCYCTWNKSTDDRITLDPSRSELFLDLKMYEKFAKSRKKCSYPYKLEVHLSRMVLYTSIAGIDLWKWIHLLSDDKKTTIMWWTIRYRLTCCPRLAPISPSGTALWRVQNTNFPQRHCSLN